MLTMDYIQHQHKYAYSTISSETLSGSCGSRNNRIRTVRLVRPSNAHLPPPNLSCRHGPSLGFSIRGGREHGTGFFISHVEPESEANNQGLKVGDQIIRINGFPVEDAVHKEVLQLISNHTHLTLKVRNVGMIPVKDKKTDSLSWHIITDNNSSSRSSPQLNEKLNDVRVTIMVAPRSRLGCGICKGPDWKPGIFVQFTKEGGIAREAGLRPGDQILYCNNVDFFDISFNEAVSLMKSSRQLDLVIRKSAGSELFPSESSGYNSSASSVTGDQSPSWSDSKRLSIVKEENLDLEDRLSHLDRLNKRISNCKNWNTLEWDEEVGDKPFFKPTIINLSENGTTIKNNGNDDSSINSRTNSTKITDIHMIPQQHETKTVFVEVHRSGTDESDDKNNKLAKCSSASSVSSITSKSSSTSLTSSSLSSAICMEIQKRMEKKTTEENKPTIDEQLQMKKILKGVSTDQHYQHNKLMDEFKKAHQKMFKGPGDMNQKNPSYINQDGNCKTTVDRLAHDQLSQKLSKRLSDLAYNEQQTDESRSSNARIKDNTPPPPPPPPPLQNGNSSSLPPSSELNSTAHNNTSNTLKTHKTKPKAPPVPVKYSVLSSYIQPPPCPTPDYDTLSISSSIFNSKPSQTMNDAVEMESLDSYRINYPSDIRPKPPDTYFQKKQLSAQSSNGSASSVTSLKKPRPVSVTIGEYPSLRREPGKLDFLQNITKDNCQRKEPITSQFASELTQTLNRSNLRKRTESVENLLGNPQIKPQSNGSIRISLTCDLSRNFTKSVNDLTDELDLCNRVMINVSHNKKIDAPSSILKNSLSNSTNTLTSPSNHKQLIQQKSITFGEKPVVIKDQLPGT